MKASKANCTVVVRLAWYDINQNFISNSDIYTDSATNPIAWTDKAVLVTTNASAHYAKLSLRISDAASSAIVRFDNVRSSPIEDADVARTISGARTFTGGVTTNALTATDNLDIGSWKLRAETFQSDVVTGTAPFIVASTTRVTNLNCDLFDDLDSSAYAILSQNEVVTGAWTLPSTTTIDGIAATNLLDKSATETVTGTWTFSNISNTSTVGGVVASNLVDKSAAETITGAWALPSTATIDGITATNLVDKSATETITGTWTIGGVSSGNLVDKTASESITGSWFLTTPVFGDSDVTPNYEATIKGSSTITSLQFLTSASGDTGTDGTVLQQSSANFYIINYEGGDMRFYSASGALDMFLDGSTRGVVISSSAGTVGQGTGTLNVQTQAYVNGQEVRSSANEYVTSGTTGLLGTSGGTATITITHGLGTDDVICRATINGGAYAFESIFVDRGDGTNEGYQDFNTTVPALATGPGATAIPASGTVKLIIRNRDTSYSSTFDYKVHIMKRNT